MGANNGGSVTRVASKKSPEILIGLALQTDRDDRFFQNAFNKLTRNLKCRPGGKRRWMYDHTAIGAYKPWRGLTEPMQLAMDAGASEEDVMAIVHCLYGIVHAHYAQPEAVTVTEALRLSINMEAREVAVQADALADPSDTNLERVVEATAADDRADETLLAICRKRLTAAALQVRGVRMQVTN